MSREPGAVLAVAAVVFVACFLAYGDGTISCQSSKTERNGSFSQPHRRHSR